jgi:hypothetical protein
MNQYVNSPESLESFNKRVSLKLSRYLNDQSKQSLSQGVGISDWFRTTKSLEVMLGELYLSVKDTENKINIHEKEVDSVIVNSQSSIERLTDIVDRINISKNLGEEVEVYYPSYLSDDKFYYDKVTGSRYSYFLNRSFGEMNLESKTESQRIVPTRIEFTTGVTGLTSDSSIKEFLGKETLDSFGVKRFIGRPGIAVDRVEVKVSYDRIVEVDTIFIDLLTWQALLMEREISIDVVFCLNGIEISEEEHTVSKFNRLIKTDKKLIDSVKFIFNRRFVNEIPFNKKLTSGYTLNQNIKSQLRKIGIDLSTEVTEVNYSLYEVGFKSIYCANLDGPKSAISSIQAGPFTGLKNFSLQGSSFLGQEDVNVEVYLESFNENGSIESEELLPLGKGNQVIEILVPLFNQEGMFYFRTSLGCRSFKVGDGEVGEFSLDNGATWQALIDGSYSCDGNNVIIRKRESDFLSYISSVYEPIQSRESAQAGIFKYKPGYAFQINSDNRYRVTVLLKKNGIVNLTDLASLPYLVVS